MRIFITKKYVDSFWDELNLAISAFPIFGSKANLFLSYILNVHRKGNTLRLLVKEIGFSSVLRLQLNKVPVIHPEKTSND